ncbi:hypothetical protein A3K73_02345 [Candidatus Pacearchaeota archaeon RBG_13_36_9]|nr:MAG: hypothetical protein A3K73_02345 [Candidatus Pacearchaeota archaeon RBG_13_36_9]
MILMLALFIALILGIIAGCLTGFLPGIHINLVAALLFGASSMLLLNFPPLALVIFIVAMSITHTFVDFIPSIFLGAPDDEAFLSVLPGHEMLNKGKGYEAVILTLYGSIAAIFMILLLAPVFILFLPKTYNSLKLIMPFILILASFFLFYFDKKSRLLAVIIFFMSGILGIASFNLGLADPLLPLFSGLFGSSSLITSIMKKQKIPKQKITKLKNIKIKRKSIVQVLVASFIASPLCSFLPGMGSGQAAVIGSEVTGDLDRKEFLILLGAVNTLVMGLSFVALYSIKKARTGTAVFAGKIIPDLAAGDLYFILGTIFLSGITAFFLTIFLARISVKMLFKVNYSKLSLVILLFISAIVIYFSNFLGFLIFFVSTFLGLACIFLNIRRTHLMGCLLLPTILYYLL